MSPQTYYRRFLALDATMAVDFWTARGQVESYSITLIAEHDSEWHTVRVFDNRHGTHHMHRHTFEGGKQEAEEVLGGTPEEAMNGAIEWIAASYRAMIDAWRP